MRAVVYSAYGPLDGLGLSDSPVPEVGGDDVLIRARAAGLHVGDVFLVRGAPLPVRAMAGWLRPRLGIPGCDVAGEVVATGPKVTGFQPGDAVFGACLGGACAELVRTSARQIAHKPQNLTFEEAAAVPTSGLAALHALRDTGKLKEGQRVLINGASGGVGTFAVQIAKALGARVTGVCGPANLGLVRSLGADEVIDYTRADFTAARPGYDVILDNVENRTLAECRRALTPAGMLILNSGTGARGLAMLVRLIKPLVLSPFVRHSLRRYLSTPNHDDLVALRELIEAEKIEPIVDKTYPLAQTAAALAYIESGHARGKVVVTIT
ncbi:MAG: NAD(P)-dependent alcohol dehydrogenase [Polyangiales bacterium]